jgi:nucleoside-diphosphate-sugar epimerase
LIHFAWIATPGVCWESEENLRWIKASQYLLQVFKEHGGVRAVVAGSCAEYDWNFGVCSESSTPLCPATLYGRSKKALYEFMKGLDISWAWGRIFHLYGPHEPSKKLVASVILSLIEGKMARCSHGKQIRDYLHVQDVADAFAALLDSRVQDAVNIASGLPVTLETLCQLIGEKMGVPERIMLGAISPALSDPSILTADVGRLFNELQWKPTLTLDEGIDKTIEWARSL